VVVLDFEPFRPRTLAVRLAAPPATVAPTAARPLALPFDRDGISGDGARTDGDFDGAGRTIAGDLLPARLSSGGIPFRTGPQAPGQANVLDCRGQTLELPEGGYDRLYLLAAAVGGDRPATFAVDGAPVTRIVPDWSEAVGQWDNRLVAGELQADPARIAPGYAKTVPVAWVGTHRHGARGENEAYAFSSLFRIAIDLPAGARRLTLPDDPRVRILAATTAASDTNEAVPAQPFVDPATATVVHIDAPHRIFVEPITVVLTSPVPGATIRYTIDGSEPSAASTIYRDPLRLERTTAVNARAFAPGLDDRFVAAATFTRVEARPPVAVDRAGLAPGLACRLYEGDWRSLPDFSALTPLRSLTLPSVGLPADGPAERFGLVCGGLLEVPGDGVYTVALRSEDGSALFVDGEKIVEKDTIDFTSARAEVALAAGLHAVELRYYQRDFTLGLELKIDGPGEPLAPVRPDRLYHVADADPPAEARLGPR